MKSQKSSNLGAVGERKQPVNGKSWHRLLPKLLNKENGSQMRSLSDLKTVSNLERN
jgi:hypothetical protein